MADNINFTIIKKELCFLSKHSCCNFADVPPKELQFVGRDWDKTATRKFG